MKEGNHEMSNRMYTSMNICTNYEFEMANLNADRDGKPKSVDGRTYISGGKIRYMFFQRMKNYLMEMEDGNWKQDKIATGDALTGDIESDYRSDIGGYMITKGEGKLVDKRDSPLKVSFSVSKKESNYLDDLFTRFKIDQKSFAEKVKSDGQEDNAEGEAEEGGAKEKEQVINTKTVSENDEMNFNYEIFIDEVGCKKDFEFEGGKFLVEVNEMVITPEEKLKRLKLSLKSTNGFNGGANVARNSVINTPKKVFICFSKVKNFIKYFEVSEIEQKHIREELKNAGEYYVIGDNTTEEKSVAQAFREAEKYINENKEFFVPVPVEAAK